jgi:hypothetical protein
MAKLSVITDEKGNVLGAVRAEPFQTSDGRSLVFRPNPKLLHHLIDVDDKLLGGPASELGKYLRANVN